ncbi:MAG TPA: hypothetical protein VMW77_10305 [Methanoregula sp.]|nr:hypothetical protein [Methanoregula sp.]
MGSGKAAGFSFIVDTQPDEQAKKMSIRISNPNNFFISYTNAQGI